MLYSVIPRNAMHDTRAPSDPNPFTKIKPKDQCCLLHNLKHPPAQSPPLPPPHPHPPEAMYSRIEERSTALPSALRE